MSASCTRSPARQADRIGINRDDSCTKLIPLKMLALRMCSLCVPTHKLQVMRSMQMQQPGRALCMTQMTSHRQTRVHTRSHTGKNWRKRRCNEPCAPCHVAAGQRGIQRAAGHQLHCNGNVVFPQAGAIAAQDVGVAEVPQVTQLPERPSPHVRLPVTGDHLECNMAGHALQGRPENLQAGEDAEGTYTNKGMQSKMVCHRHMVSHPLGRSHSKDHVK